MFSIAAAVFALVAVRLYWPLFKARASASGEAGRQASVGSVTP
jgi:hypothetical protein